MDGNSPVTTPVFRYDITYTAGVSGNHRIYSDNYRLSLIGEAVHISVQPAATASVAANSSGTICSVDAGGTTSPTYTWKRNGTAISGGAYESYYSGFSSATLSAVNIPSSEDGVSLTCTVGGTYAQSGGATTVDSTACVLDVGAGDPCLGVADVGGINKSPLAPAGQVYSDVTTITCTGCSGSATAVTIKDKSNGDAVVGTATGGSGTVVVSVSGLVTAHILCAVQTVGGVESCVISAPTVTVGNPGYSYVPAVGGISIVDPITAGDTSVTVFGVSDSAEDVTVYADGVQIGQNAAPGGATTVVVTTSPLVKGKYLAASQKLSGTEGSIPGSGGAPIVGGGNAGLRVCLEFTVGADTLVWLGASGRSGSYASSPTGAALVSPGVGWQTLTWIPGTSPAYRWGTATTYNFPSSGSATLEYIWLVADDNSEMGPYTVYIDNVKNGDTVVEAFETGFAGGNSAFMAQPSFASVGRTAIHDNPNATLCVDTIADVGAKSQEMAWEFVNSLPLANGPINEIRGVLKNPVTCDLSKPISFRILVLPAGVSSAALQIGQPANKVITTGVADSVNMTATVNSFGGSGTLAYQWKKAGSPIDNATDSSLSFPAPSAGDAGNYSCAVTYTVTGGTQPGTYSSECNPFAVTLNNRPVAQNISLGGLSGVATTLQIIGGKHPPTDADSGDTLTVYSVDSTTANGGSASVSTDKSSIIYTAPSGQTADSFTYTVTDGKGVSVAATVSVTVTAGGGQSPNVVSPPAYTDGKFSVTFAGIPDVEYTVEYTTAFPATSGWTWLKNVTAGATGLFVVEDEVSSDPQRYYRTVYPSYTP